MPSGGWHFCLQISRHDRLRKRLGFTHVGGGSAGKMGNNDAQRRKVEDAKTLEFLEFKVRHSAIDTLHTCFSIPNTETNIRCQDVEPSASTREGPARRGFGKASPRVSRRCGAKGAVEGARHVFPRAGSRMTGVAMQRGSLMETGWVSCGSAVLGNRVVVRGKCFGEQPPHRGLTSFRGTTPSSAKR